MAEVNGTSVEGSGPTGVRFGFLPMPGTPQHSMVSDFTLRCLLPLSHAPYNPPEISHLEKCVILVALSYPKDVPHAKVVGQEANGALCDVLSLLNFSQACSSEPVREVLGNRLQPAVIGYVAATFYDAAMSLSGRNQVGYISSVVVSSGWRRRGVGRRMLDFMLSFGRNERNVGRFMLHVMRDVPGAEAARLFYASFGFRLHRMLPGYYGEGLDGQAMILDEGRKRLRNVQS